MSSIRRLASRVIYETPVVLPSVGDIKHSTVPEDHLGWIKCDGRLLDSSKYPELFARIGNSFGSSGAQFRLPDPRGRVLGVIGAGAGLTPRSLGDAVGAETHTLIIAEMPAHKHGAVDVSGNTNGSGATAADGIHSHSIVDNGHTHSMPDIPSGTQNIAAPSGGDTTAADEVRYLGTTGSRTTGITINNSVAHTHAIGSTGGGAPHNNMQPTLFAGHMYIFAGHYAPPSLVA